MPRTKVERTYSTRSKLQPEESQEKEEKPKRKSPTKKTPSKRVKPSEQPDAEKSEILERGHIYFFYRKKIDTKEAHGLEDVQKLYLLLWPLQKESPLRLIVISKKKLPEIARHGKYFAFVEKVSLFVEEIDQPLDPHTYLTKTMGERYLSGVVPVGEGIYAIVESERGKRKHTHLVYVLEVPSEIGKVQKAFNIEHEGSFVINVKNPESPASFLSKKEKAKLPSQLQNVFEERKWNRVNPTSLLDYEGMELILIGASSDLVKEMGQVGEELEEFEKVDARRVTDESIFKDLHLKKSEHPRRPLTKGEWA
jgi:hypothetical protein